MQSLSFKSPTGQEITFENAPPYVGWIYDGMGIPDSLALTDRASGQDGYTAYDVLMGSRRITLTGHIHGAKGGDEGIREMYLYRKKLMGVLNPKYGLGELTYRNDSGTWKIPAYCSSTPYVNKIKNFHTIEIHFECPDPYFRSKYPSKLNLAHIKGNLSFPLYTPGFFGTMGYEAIIDNDSDIYLPLEFTIDGGSINPTIRNKATGESFTIERTMTAHEKLYINTDTNNPAVRIGFIDDETSDWKWINAWSYLKRGYDLIHLVPGRNILTFSSDDETRDVKIIIEFHKKYVAV